MENRRHNSAGESRRQAEIPLESKAVSEPLQSADEPGLGERNAQLNETILQLQREIRERNRTINDLRGNEEQFRLMVEGVKDYAIVMLDVRGNIVSWNAGAACIKGYRADEIVGQHFSRFYAREDVQSGKPERELATAAAEGRFEEEGWRVRKDGSRFIANVVITAMRDDAGLLRGYAKIVRDITERKQAENAMKEKESLIQGAIDALSSNICVLDYTGRIIAVNKAWHDFAAANPPTPGNGVESANYLDICEAASDDTDAVRFLAGIRAVMNGEQNEFSLEYSCHSPDERRWFIGRVTRFHNRGCPHLVIAHENITDRKLAEEAFRDLALQMTRATDKERHRIARNLHDSAGQNLFALSVAIGAIQDSHGLSVVKLEKALADCQGIIDQCAQEIRTQSYLLHPPLLDELGLNAALAEYTDGFSKRSGVKVVLEVLPTHNRLPDELEIALFRVAQEGLANIHRHVGVSTARIRLACDAEQVILEVSDQGCGIPAEKLRTINMGRGFAGIGIAGMRERLRLLGGRLEIDSGSQGTTLRAIVPQREAS